MKNKMRIAKLSGQVNQCPTCGEYFNSNAAFDKHRIGVFGNHTDNPRRCMSVDEMKSAGMAKNFRNLWVTALNTMYQEHEHEEV